MLSWKKYSLGELLTFENGSSLPRNQLVEQGDGYCLHYGDIHLNGELNYFDVARDSSWLPMVNLQEMKKYSELHTGDIVFADASEDYDGIGKSVTIVNETDMPFIPGLHTIVGRSKIDALDLEYKKYFLKSQKVRKQFRRVAAGSSVFGVNSYEIAKFTVEIPESKEEQNKIGCILTSVDEQITQMADKIEYYTELKKALAKKLLAEGIGHTEFKDSEVGRIPVEWKVKSLCDTTEYVDYRGKTPCKTAEGVFLVTAKNVRQGFIDYSLSQEYISEDDYEDVMHRGKPLCGDVLFTTEAPCGYVAQVDREDIALAQRIIKYRAEGELTNDFLKFILAGDEFQSRLMKLASGGTVKGIKGSVLHKMMIPIPSIEEQNEISEILKNVELCIADYTEQHTDLTKLKEALMQQLLTGKVRVTI